MSSVPAIAAPPSYRHVLVPLDGSDLAEGALATARALAARMGAGVDTVSIAPSPADTDALRKRAAVVLGTGADDAHVHVEVGDDPAAGIARWADELGSCLVCMSTHGRGRVAGAVIGSVARSLLERGKGPVVLVSPAASRPDRDRSSWTPPLGADRLVAGVDGGTASERVLPVAAAWAQALGMTLTIVTVAEPSPPPLRTGEPWHRHHGPEADADEYVRRLRERWEQAAPGVQAHVVYDPISAAGGFKDYLASHPTGLVAVTTHARSGLGRVVFGSGAADIVRASTAPVLVVPFDE